MGAPVAAIMSFGAYAYIMVWYSMPGFGYLSADAVKRPDAWIGDLSLALPCTATVLYLSMCFFGPKLMAKREAFDPKGFMLVYNAYQTVFNIITVAIFVMELYRTGTKAWGGRLSWTNPDSFYILLGIWLHYNNKYLELLDTVFMVGMDERNVRATDAAPPRRDGGFGVASRPVPKANLTEEPLPPRSIRTRTYQISLCCFCARRLLAAASDGDDDFGLLFIVLDDLAA